MIRDCLVSLPHSHLDRVESFLLGAEAFDGDDRRALNRVQGSEAGVDSAVPAHVERYDGPSIRVLVPGGHKRKRVREAVCMCSVWDA